MPNEEVADFPEVFGRFKFRLLRKGKLEREWESKNFLVSAGKDYLLNRLRGNATTDITTWYLGVANNSHSRTLTDTLGSFGANEETINDYSGSTRKSWGMGAPAEGASAAVRQITNASTVDFIATTSTTAETIFLTNASTGTTGYLISEAEIDTSPVQLSNSDTLQVTYTLGISQASS